MVLGEFSNRDFSLIGKSVYVRFRNFSTSPFVRRTVVARPADGLVQLDRPLNELLIETQEEPASAVYAEDELDIRPIPHQ